MAASRKYKITVPNPPVDFVIITALEEERDAMLSKLTGYKKLDKESGDIYTYYYAEVKSLRNDSAIYQVVVASPLNMGPLNATALTISLVNKWNPQFVILTGIACGIKGEVNYGDVMIATQVADYTLAKQQNGMRKVRWEVFPSGPSLLDSSNNIDAKWVSQIKQLRPDKNDVAKVKGVIASGGDVISDDELIKEYSESWPKLIGIEMESGGVAAGVHQTSDRPEFLMVKSVSDFGKDKHNSEVKPWRNYACHSAAAFTIGLIKSGPFQNSLIVKDKSGKEKKEEEEKEAAERRWQYIQNHAITNIEIQFFLKSSVGYKWFVDLFDDIHISFSREKRGVTLKEVLKNSPEPNKKEHEKKSGMPSSSFWEIYEEEEGYWCKRINPKERTFELIAGFDCIIPWDFFKITDINSLQELAICNDIGISFPPRIFQAELEEIIFRIEGETYSFSVYISDETPLEMYHEMARTFHSMDIKGGLPMNFAMSFQGVQLLDMFHKQTMPGYKRAGKKDGIFGGMHGPKSSISFYPTIPNGFSKTKESNEYSFTINTTKEVDYKGLEKELKKKIEKDNRNIDNYLKLASIYSVQGRFQDVIKFIATEINTLKPNSDLHGILGNAYANLGRYKQALAEFKIAESLTPKNAKVQVHLGLCLQEMNEDELAIVHFKKAIQLEPSNAKYQATLGRALGNVKKISDAIIPARKAVKLDPDNSENHILLGMLLNLNGKAKEAFEYFEKAIQIDPNSPKAFRCYAEVLAKEGEIEKAIENFKHSTELKKDIDCYADWGRMLCDSGRWKEAESVIREGLGIEPKHHALLIYLGVARANQGDFKDAIIQFEKANSIDSKDKTATELIAKVKTHMQRETKRQKKK